MAEFRIVEDEVGHLLVALKGRLDLEGVHSVENALTLRVHASRKSTLLDLSEVPFLASLAMGMLVSMYKGLRLHGVRLVLVAPPPLVAEALHNASIDGAIPIAADRDTALALLGGR